MADTYNTDEEQIEALKKWWKENGKSTVLGILIALAVVFGWHSWQKQQAQKLAMASSVFDNLVVAANANQGDMDDAQMATAEHLADTLLTEFSDTAYAEFARLYKAQFAVKAKDYTGAAEQLSLLIDNSKEEPLVEQAQFRLAKVRFAEEKYAATLELLSAHNDAASLELKGDVALAQGDTQKALATYEQAQEKLAADSQQSALLTMKIQHLRSVLNNPVDEA